MPGPDVPAIAIGIMKKKGMAPPGEHEEAPEGHEVTPDELDGAHDLMAAIEMKDPHAIARSLCNFMDIYNAPPSEEHGEPDGDEGNASEEG